jgi:regulatory protein
VTQGDGPPSDPREVGRIIGLRLLEAKPRTVGELRDRLCDRGIPQDVADEIVGRYLEVGLLDDRAYARLWVESRVRARGLGVAALRRELRGRKVPDDIITEVLGGLDGEDARAAAVQRVRGRVSRCRLPLSGKDERRLIAFLMRRGHSTEDARIILATAVNQVVDSVGGGGR